ncbi:MAG TPA: hypothetical protein ENG27_00440, partial [Candidatus Bathyarchaeota archaeon]|nr:hypothetical protein [Candidatus Bathyarchaeota archaeon]
MLTAFILALLTLNIAFSCPISPPIGDFEDGLGEWESAKKNLILHNTTKIHPTFEHALYVAAEVAFSGSQSVFGKSKVNAPTETSYDPSLPLGEQRSYTWLISGWFKSGRNGRVTLYMRGIDASTSSTWGYGAYILVVFEDKNGNEQPDVMGDFNHAEIYALSLVAIHEGMGFKNSYKSIVKGSDGEDWYFYEVEVPKQMWDKCIRIKILWLAQNWNSWGATNYVSISSFVDRVEIKFPKKPSKISLSLSRREVQVGEEIEIRGKLDPPINTLVTIQYKESGEWKVLEEVQAKNGVFSYNYTPTKAGTVYFKASWKGNDQYKASKSYIYMLIVREGNDFYIDSIEPHPAPPLVLGKPLSITVNVAARFPGLAEGCEVEVGIKVELLGVRGESEYRWTIWSGVLSATFHGGQAAAILEISPQSWPRRYSNLDEIRITAVVDPDNSYEELDEDNNSGVQAFSLVHLPDLSVKPVDYHLTMTPPPEAGSQTVVVIMISNIGNADQTDTWFAQLSVKAVLVDGSRVDIYSETLKGPPINEGDDVTLISGPIEVPHTLNGKTVVDLLVHVEADSHGSVEEISEENNLAEKVFHVVSALTP